MSCKILSLLIFFCFCTAKDGTAYFFDVGQGHCFFFKSNRNNVAVLIDAGSKKAPVDPIPAYKHKRAEAVNPLRKEQIIEKINECGINRATKFLCIVTHGDEDHYGWLQDIIGALPSKPGLCILGGSKNNYPDQYEITSGKDIFVADKYRSTDGRHITALNTAISRFLGSTDDLEIKILHASNDLTAKSEEEKNDHSIVTRVQLGNFSFLITGDAGSNITDAIRTNIPRPEVEATVLLASHHGATTHGSNDSSWFQFVNPEYVVFSHGDVKEFFHPHPSAVWHALQLPKIYKDVTTNNHVLFYGPREGDQAIIDIDPTGTTRKFARTFAQIHVGYRLMLTNANLLSTFTQGDIVFNMPNVRTQPMTVGWSKTVNEFNPSYAFSDSTQLTMTGYLNNPNLGNEVTHLWLRGCPHFFEQFTSFSAVTNPQTLPLKMKNLKELECKQVTSPIVDPECTNKLLRLVVADTNTPSPQLKTLDFRNNALDSDKAVLFEKAWGYRGLTLIPQ